MDWNMIVLVIAAFLGVIAIIFSCGAGFWYMVSTFIAAMESKKSPGDTTDFKTPHDGALFNARFFIFISLSIFAGFVLAFTLVDFA